MNNTDKFVQASIRERQALDIILPKIGAKDIQHSDENSMDRWDTKFSIGKHNYIAEIKCRNVSSTAYKETLIEVSKINALAKLAVNTSRIPLLIIKFADNTVRVFNLFSNSLNGCTVTTKYCNKTTAVKTQKVAKSVVLIPISLGKEVIL